MESVKVKIGPDGHEFIIPRVLIAKNTYLDTNLHFIQAKMMGKDSNDLLIELQNEDPRLFGEFVKFISGDDFEWDEEIARYFDFMGYHNNQDYPLDYWKIKLKDNWIRDNFYSLELWNEKSELPPIGINRGPYIGLVDITEIFNKSKWTERSRDGAIKQISKLNDFINFDGDIILAGGALASILNSSMPDIHDLDFFITSKDPDVGESKIIQLIADYHYIKFFPCRVEIEYVAPRRVIRTDKAITIGCGYGKMQIIFRLYHCPSEVVHGFDLDASGILYDGKKIWATERAKYAIEKKVNFFDCDRMSPSYGYRLAKYVDKGFDVWLPGFDRNRISWERIYKISHGGIVIGDLFNDSLNEYLSDVRYVPRKYHEDIGKRLSLDFLNKNNPVDVILYTLFVGHIPKSHKIQTCDYDPNVVNAGKHYKLFTRHRFNSFPTSDNYTISDVNTGINTEIIDETEEEIDEEEWCILAGDGYVIYTNPQSLRLAPIDDILNLSQEVAEASGLSSNIRWNTQDPMTQLSGTFQPTKVSNIDSIYQESYLYDDVSEVRPQLRFIKPCSFVI